MWWGGGWGLSKESCVWSSTAGVLGLFGIRVHTVSLHKRIQSGYFFSCFGMNPWSILWWLMGHSSETLPQRTLKNKYIGLLACCGHPSIHGFLSAFYSLWFPLGSGTQDRHFQLCICLWLSASVFSSAHDGWQYLLFSDHLIPVRAPHLE